MQNNYKKKSLNQKKRKICYKTTSSFYKCKGKKFDVPSQCAVLLKASQWGFISEAQIKAFIASFIYYKII